MDTLRILIIAADPLARAGLAALLNTQDTHIVVSQIGQLTDWDEVLQVFRPDVALWDLGWEIDEAFQFDTLAEGNLPIVVLVPDDTHITQLLDADIMGILLRENSAEQLVIALSAAANQLRVLDPALPLIPVNDTLSPLTNEFPKPLEPLTPREIEVLNLLAEGLTNKAIGQALDISPHTVKFHVSAIISKLDAQSRTEAVVLATRMGLLPL